ncbi:hypothetical protein BGZ74_011671 [Mortierella antarctica]|nr:hypothetical protein BGZ74_011671 [Mortierella antarctica]
MSFGGYNPASDLPFTTAGGVPTTMRSRTSSISSVHSNQGVPPPQQQQQQQQQQQGAYSQPGTPGTRGRGAGPGHDYFNGQSGYGGYESYGSNPPTPGAPTPYHSGPPQQQHPGYGNAPRNHGSGYSSGYDSPTSAYPPKDMNGFPQQQPSTPHRQRRHHHAHHHQRTHSNASETSLNIDTSFANGTYSPGPASLSSAGSSRRNSISEAGVAGGFFAQKGPTFRPGNKSQFRDADNDDEEEKDGTDAYDDDDDDEDDYEGLTENEKWKKKQLAKKGWESRRGQILIMATLVTLAMFVRIWKVAIPASVVFDEQHFGGFTVDYLNKMFFVDVHPPLGKMMFAAVAYLLGFDGNFDFMLGRLYTKNVPYIGMRLLSIACGVGLVPISYLTIKNSGHSTQAASICAILVTFENALITQSRFILLDAPMMLFMGYTILAWVNFYNYRNRPFTRGWWTWLIQTGIGLFLSSSVKWVGLFTIATVGLCVLKYLQESRTHLYTSTRDFSKQFIALFVCLLVLPFVLYMGLYAIDFQILSHSGSGNLWVSPQFQMTLKKHDVQPVMADLAWESKIHIRHANTNGGWVHSMPGEYARDGTVDQAIQLVEWDDDLTCWHVFTPDNTIQDQYLKNREDRKANPAVAFNGYIFDGDKVRLRHCYSKVALAAHDLVSIGSNKSFIREMRGIKWIREEPAPESVWRVELVPDGLVPGLADGHQADLTQESGEQIDKVGGRNTHPSKQWHAIKGFRLYNEHLNCYLHSHKVFRSPYSTYQEVGCIQGDRQKTNTYFVIDKNVNPHLPASTKSLSYKPLSFFQKFIEINRVMWWTHHDLNSPVHGDFYNGQTKKSSDESLPWSWPFLNRGLNYFSSKETNHYVYLMGNPLLWWASSTAAIVYMFSCIWSAVNYIRGKPETKHERARFGITPFYAVASGTFYAGWAIHYFPFFFMHRQLYLHHYLPALYFSILLLVSRLDRVFQRWPTRARYTAGLLLLAAAILSWHCLAPLAYGTDFSSRSKCEKIRSLGGWEFVCQRQNLPWARPQAAAKIVVEKRADHERHEAQEEAENSQFYYQDPTRDSDAGFLRDGHEEQVNDHGGGGGGEEEEGGNDHDHDHAGPYNQDESQHYDHEHFYHSGHQGKKNQSHGHESHDQAAEAKRQADAAASIAAEAAREQAEAAAHAQAQAAEERAQAEIRARAQEEEQQQEQQRLQTQEQEEEKRKVQEEQEAQQAAEKPEGWESRLALAEARAKEIQEKVDLLAAKVALERKQKELEKKLAAQEAELLRQKLLHEKQAREKKKNSEDEKEEEERQVREKLQKDAQDRERREKLEEELRQKREEELRMEEEEKEWERAFQQKRLQQEREYQEQLRREEDERRAQEEKRQRYEQQQRNVEERRRAYEEERQRYKQERERQREERERQRKERERQREEQERERQRQDAARLAVEDQAAMEAAMAAMGAGGDFGGQYGVAQPPPPGVMAHRDPIHEDAGGGAAYAARAGGQQPENV